MVPLKIDDPKPLLPWGVAACGRSLSLLLLKILRDLRNTPVGGRDTERLRRRGKSRVPLRSDPSRHRNRRRGGLSAGVHRALLEVAPATVGVGAAGGGIRPAPSFAVAKVAASI